MASATDLVDDTAPHIDIPRPTTILELRTGKLKQFGTVLSAIHKDIRQGQLFVSEEGLTDDEHDRTFHGGPEKAVHQYNADHYPGWRERYPEAADRFVYGGFGENLVTKGWSEDNICAGDIVRIGYFDDRVVENPLNKGNVGCLLQVSLPRQPCFKLNQRFGIKNFAPVTHATNRTGWYYRVKEKGWIEQGMQMQIIERPNPQWPISRLHEYVHRDQNNLFAIQTLQKLPHLGQECAGTFKKRWEAMENEKKRAAEKWRAYRLQKKTVETPRVKSFFFKAVNEEDKPQPVKHGSHVSIKLPNGLQRAYSVVSGDTNCFQLGIARDESSRGGSVYLHDELKEGDQIEAGTITQSLKASDMASKHIMIAGGIGITAFPVMLAHLTKINQEAELHYCVRNEVEIAFRSLLKFGDKVKTYDASKGQRLNIKEVLEKRAWNSHVYVCGPQRMIEAVQQSAQEAGMTEDEVHFETFKVEIGGDPFTAEVQAGTHKKQLAVSSDQSLLQALRNSGFEVGSSCEAGTCGTCRVRLVCGKVSHVGSGLTEEEKATELLSCVSRGIGHIEISIEASDSSA